MLKIVGSDPFYIMDSKGNVYHTAYAVRQRAEVELVELSTKGWDDTDFIRNPKNCIEWNGHAGKGLPKKRVYRTSGY